ncbi:RelA/SpoT family protein [Patescibacteria group bacterium]
MIVHNVTKEEFFTILKEANRKLDFDEIERAFIYAKKAHEGQKRDDGTPYLDHPVGTAVTLAKMGMDTTTIVAGLLHDLAEDTTISLDTIRRDFGDDVFVLVRGATKINNPTTYNREENQIKTLQRMFLAMAKDIRSVLVKLADRMNNMETLEVKSRDKQREIAEQTLDIYAPIANRLGMGEMKGQLEDIAFRYLYPVEFDWVEKYAYRDIQRRLKVVDDLQSVVQDVLKDAKIDVVATDGRVKHKYSLYRKLLRYNKDLDQIHDLVALRVIVPDISTCYEVLGILHNNYQPLPGRIKDYISTPKPNGYQSLHTTVQVQKDEVVEFQVRTAEMHQRAEYGIAAHWHYEEKTLAHVLGKRHSVKPSKKELEWVKALSKWRNEVQDSDEYFESLKIDFFKDRIYVRSPRGDIFDLPEGSTPLDFAYRVHTEVGHKYAGAKVNGRIVKMSQELHNNDVVEILTTKNADGPNRKWMDFVKTSNARAKIRNWLRDKNPTENIEIGKQILDRRIQFLTKLKLSTFIERLTDEDLQRVLDAVEASDFDHLYEALGNGSTTIETIQEKIQRNDPLLFGRIVKLAVHEGLKKEKVHRIDNTKKIRVVVNNDPSLQSSLALCCKPTKKDAITGYLTKKKGIVVHQNDCENLDGNLDKSKFIRAVWEEQFAEQRTITIKALVQRKPGSLRDMTSEIENSGLNVSNIKAGLLNEKQGYVRVQIFVDDITQLEDLCRKIEKLDYVDEVARI